MLEKKWSTLCNCSVRGGGGVYFVLRQIHQMSRSSVDSQSIHSPLFFRKMVGRPSWIAKPDARFLGSSVTEITVRSGKLALYPVDLTKK